MTKILSLVPSYAPFQSGGSAYSSKRLNDSLIEAGYDVTVISTADADRVRMKSKDLTKIPMIHFFSKFSLYGVLRVFAIIKNVDVLHISSIFHFRHIIILILSRLFGVKLIVSPRGELMRSAFFEKKWMKKIILAFLQVFISKQAKFHFTSIEEYTQAQCYLTNLSDRYFIIPNGLSHQERINENVRKNDRKIVFVGRINRIKNIEAIFDIIKGTDFSLDIIGEADTERSKSYLTFLKQKICSEQLEEKVRFLGRLEDPMKSDIVASSRFLFLPSHSENFGNVVIESLRLGVPVFASKGTPWSILEKEECGFHVNFSEPDAIRSLLTSQTNDSYEKLRVNALKLSKSYSSQAVLRAWLQQI